MQILCVICSDIFKKPEDVYSTRCGHVFHLECLTQWLERSKTCPQCRLKVTQSQIHKLYLSVSNDESNTRSVGLIEDAIANCEVQLLLKEKLIKYQTSKNAILEKQNAGLRKEVRKLESEINRKNSDEYALKEEIVHFKEEFSRYESAKKEIILLKKKIEEFKELQLLLDAPVKDITQMIEKNRDTETLVKFITVMKRELLSNINKLKKSKITVKMLQDETAEMSMQCSLLFEDRVRKQQLEEKLTYSEIESMILRMRVKKLEGILGSTKNADVINELPQKLKLEQTKLIDNSEKPMLSKCTDRKRTYSNSSLNIQKEQSSDSQASTANGTENRQNTSVQDTKLSEKSTLNSTDKDTAILEKRIKLSGSNKDDILQNNYQSSQCSNSSMNRRSQRKRQDITMDKLKKPY